MNENINVAAPNQQKNGFILRPSTPEPLTFEQAKNLKSGTTIFHRTMKNTDGTPMRARVMGAVKLWKSRPEAIRVPMKRGLRDTFQLGQGETDKGIDQPLENWSLKDE